MAFFEKHEVGVRIYRCVERGGHSHEPIAIHKCTRGKHHGFMAVGPLFQGRADAGLAWFDIRVRPNTPEFVLLNQYVKQVCRELNLNYLDAG